VWLAEAPPLAGKVCMQWSRDAHRQRPRSVTMTLLLVLNSSSCHNILLSFVNSIIVLRTEVTAYGLVVFGPTVEKGLSKMWLL